MPSSAESVRLHRSVVARIAGGWTFQIFVSMAIVFDVAIGAVVTYFVGPPALLSLLPSLALLLLWSVGVSAWAVADATGVRWRYFRRRAFGWDQIEAVELRRGRHAGTGGFGTPLVAVLAGGRSHAIGPALGISNRSLKSFVEDLSGLARSHGVPVSTDPSDTFFSELLAGDLT